MAYKLVADLDGAPDLPNVTRRLHWREARKRASYWRLYVMRVAGGSKAPPEPLERARVLIEVWRKRAPDPDNLVASIKPLIDGLQPARTFSRKGRNGERLSYPVPGAGVIADDRAANFKGGHAEVVFRQCKRKERVRVRITVEEVEHG